MKKTPVCNWWQDLEGGFDTDCDNKFQFTEGGPRENGMKFCCYCGRPLRDRRLQPK